MVGRLSIGWRRGAGMMACLALAWQPLAAAPSVVAPIVVAQATPQAAAPPPADNAPLVCAEAELSPKGLPHLADAVAAHRAPRILFVGSSTTVGVGASAPEQAYPARLIDLIRNGYQPPAESRISAGAGDLAGATVERLARELRRGKYDVVLWQGFINDAIAGAKIRTLRRMVLRAMALTSSANADLIVVGPQGNPAMQSSPSYSRVARELRSLSRNNGITFMRRYRRAEIAKQTEAGLFAADRFHLSDAGHACLAAAIYDQVFAPVLKGK